MISDVERQPGDAVIADFEADSGLLELASIAPVEDDRGAGIEQTTGKRKANTLRRTCDQRGFAREVEKLSGVLVQV